MCSSSTTAASWANSKARVYSLLRILRLPAALACSSSRRACARAASRPARPSAGPSPWPSFVLAICAKTPNTPNWQQDSGILGNCQLAGLYMADGVSAQKLIFSFWPEQIGEGAIWSHDLSHDPYSAGPRPGCSAVTSLARAASGR